MHKTFGMRKSSGALPPSGLRPWSAAVGGGVGAVEVTIAAVVLGAEGEVVAGEETVVDSFDTGVAVESTATERSVRASGSTPAVPHPANNDASPTATPIDRVMRFVMNDSSARNTRDLTAWQSPMTRYRRWYSLRTGGKLLKRHDILRQESSSRIKRSCRCGSQD